MYCRQCGEKLTLRFCENEGLVPYCDKCEAYIFPQFNVAVSMVVTNRAQDKILLAKHVEDEDFILFAGYIKKGENAEKTVPGNQGRTRLKRREGEVYVLALSCAEGRSHAQFHRRRRRHPHQTQRGRDFGSEMVHARRGFKTDQKRHHRRIFPHQRRQGIEEKNLKAPVFRKRFPCVIFLIGFIAHRGDLYG